MVRAKQKSDDVCRNYAASAPDVCEITRYLTDDVCGWMANYRLPGLDTHHIFGKPKPVERNWNCSLIRISKAAHTWLHDKDPVAGRLVCLYAKMKRHQQQMLLYPELATTPETLHWNVEAMNLCVSPKRSFSGVVELLWLQVHELEFKAYGLEILEYLGE